MSLGPRTRALFVAIVPLAMLVTLLAWAASSPPGSSPDDDYHMASIWCGGSPAVGICEETASSNYRRLPADLVTAADCFAHDGNQAASCARNEGETRITDRGNWAGNAYPPLFYAVMHAFVTEDLSTSVLVMRSVNAGLYVCLMTALYFLLPRPRRPLVVWSAAISLIPLGVFLIASVNPSAWAIISATGLWLATWGFFESRGPRKWLLAGMAAILLVMGAGARSDAAVYGVLAVIVAAVLAFQRERRYFRDLTLPVALSLVAVWFFFSGAQSGVVSSVASTEAPYELSTLAFIDLKLLPELWAGVFGTPGWGLGWFDTPMPGTVWVTGIAIYAALLFWGFRTGDWRKWLAVLGIGVSLVIIPMYILLHDGVIVGYYVQPRYVYPLIIVLGGVALVGLTRAGMSLSRIQLIAVAAALTVANSVALHVNLRRYVTGLDVPNFNLNAGAEWWWNSPIQPMLVWAVGTGAGALAATILVWAVWSEFERVEPAIKSQSLLGTPS